MSEKNIRKKGKKLKKFLDKTQSFSYRLKALVEYSERASETDDESIYVTHSLDVVSILFDAYSACESMSRKGKYSELTIFQIHDVISKFLTFTSGDVVLQWYNKIFFNIFELSLSTNNKPGLRYAALRNLLVVCTLIGKVEKAVPRQLAGAFDMTPFLNDFPEGTHLSLKPIGEHTLLPRDVKNPTVTKEETVEMLRICLEYISELQFEQFEEWFGYLLKYVFSSFYPAACRQMGIIDATEFSGFVQHCPYEVHSLMIGFLALWCKKEEIFRFLWLKQDHLMFEIFKQSCLMPQNYYKVICQALEVFFMLMTSKLDCVESKLLLKYRKWYFENLVYIVPESPLGANCLKLIEKCLDLYKSMDSDWFLGLDEKIQRVAYNTLISLASRVLRRPDSCGVDNALCSILVEFLISFWIKTSVTNIRTWESLCDCIFLLFHRKDAIFQCKVKLIQLTLILKNFMNLSKRDGSAHRQQRIRVDGCSFPNAVVPMMEYKDYPALDVGFQWNWDKAVFVWSRLLEIFKSINSLKDPGTYYLAIDAFTSPIGILIYSYDNLCSGSEDLDFFSEERYIDLRLLNIFGPRLFEAFNRSSLYSDTKAVACKHLCRIFMRKVNYRLPLPVLAHFYDTLHELLLNLGDTKTSWSVIENTSTIFSHDLPGVNLLIPYYLEGIESIFGKLDSVTDTVIEASLTILGSLVFIPMHLRDLFLPLDSKFRGKGFDEDERGIQLGSLKLRIFSIVERVLGKDRKSRHLSMMISIVNMLLLSEIYTENPLWSFVNSCINVIFRCNVFGAECSSLAVTYLGDLVEVSDRLKHAIRLRICTHIFRSIFKYQMNPNCQVLTEALYNAGLRWVILHPEFFGKSLINCVDAVLTHDEDESQRHLIGSSSMNYLDPNEHLRLRELVERFCFQLNNFLYVYPLYPSYDMLESKVSDYEGSQMNFEKEGTLTTRSLDLTPISPPDANNRDLDKNDGVSGVLDDSPVSNEENFTTMTMACKSVITTTGGENPSKRIVSMGSKVGEGIERALEGLDIQKRGSFERCVSEISGAMASHRSSADGHRNVIWMTWSEKNVFSLFDRGYHDPEVLDADEDRAMRYVLESRHYLLFFGRFLEMRNFRIILDYYFQYAKGGNEVSEVNRRIDGKIDFFISSLESFNCEFLPVKTDLGSKIWSVLRFYFSLFRGSGLWDQSQKQCCMLTSRDYTGKYTWKLRYVDEWKYSMGATNCRLLSRELMGGNKSHFDGFIDKAGSKLGVFESHDGQSQLQQFFKSSSNADEPDFRVDPSMNLEGLMTGVSINPFAKDVNLFLKHTDFESSYYKCKQMENLIQVQIKIVNAYHIHMKKESTYEEFKTKFLSFMPIKRDPFYATRLFLHDIGMISRDLNSAIKIFPRNNPKFKRIIKEMDLKMYGHETVKAGLVYVKYGQEEQNQLLQNQYPDTSKNYAEYAKSLGIAVDSSRHRGYLGGVNRLDSKVQLLYYNTFQVEMILHEVVRMQTVQKDPQQIHKKRHVGNDFANIVWSEHFKEYNPNTIVSDFNKVVLVISPLPNGLFAIKIAQKGEIANFGPLLHGVMIPKSCLAHLTRSTTIIASCRSNTLQKKHPDNFASRRKILHECIHKSIHTAEFDKLLGQIFLHRIMVRY